MYEDLINDCKLEIKDNLVSIIKFGTEGQSDNILIIAKQLKFDDLKIIKPIVLKFRKKTKITPIFFTESGLTDSTDVFPLEILDMIYHHELLHGIDVLKNVNVEKSHVRKQIEFELRSKLIHLREDYLAIKSNSDIKLLLKSAVPTLMPLFYGLLFIKDINPSDKLEGLYAKIAENYDVDLGVFLKIREKKINNSELEEDISNLINLLEKLINIIDKIDL